MRVGGCVCARAAFLTGASESCQELAQAAERCGGQRRGSQL